MTRSLRQLILFAGASSVGAGIDFVLILALTAAGLAAWAAVALSMCVSASVVYLIHETVTFRDPARGGRDARRWSAFLGWTVVVYATRVAAYYALTAFGVPHVAAVALALVSTLLLNFTVSQRRIFVRK